jgi:diadenosine tetraphosphatase ApaH/serine/threonine PP2A family protein phosphatase
MVRERATVALAGNHDRWVTGGLSLDMLALPAHRAELRWQLSRLSAEQFEWLSGLSAHAERAGIELWHASAEDPLTAWIENQSDVGTHLALQRVPVGLVGHTHRPLVARLTVRGVSWNEHPQRERLDDHGRAVLNPGAVIRAHRWLELDIDRKLAVWHTA